MVEDSLLKSMMKSELIELMARKQSHLAYKDVELAVKSLLEQMSESLSTGERIEIRGFGSFSLHFRPPRAGQQPDLCPRLRLHAPRPRGGLPHERRAESPQDRAIRNRN